MHIVNNVTSTFVFPGQAKYNLFTYERIFIRPGEMKQIVLPYSRDFIDENFLLFELDSKLALKGLLLVGHNLNDESSIDDFRFVVKSLTEKPRIPTLFLAQQNIDILPNTLFGRVYELKNST